MTANHTTREGAESEHSAPLQEPSAASPSRSTEQSCSTESYYENPPDDWIDALDRHLGETDISKMALIRSLFNIC